MYIVKRFIATNDYILYKIKILKDIILFIIMDVDIINLFKKCSIDISGQNLEGIILDREFFLSDSIYDTVSEDIAILKQKYSSSSLTSLQKTAKEEQRWPLLNLIRQILRMENYTMEPIRKADGYTLDGKKKYKRFFCIKKMKKNDVSNNDVKNIDISNNSANYNVKNIDISLNSI